MNDNNAPKSPELKKLAKHIQTIDEIINSGWDVTAHTDKGEPQVEFKESELVEIRDALDWTLTFLENRRDYHKKRQTKAKVEQALMEEKLREAGVDIDAIRKSAVKLSEDVLLEEEN